eukprot:CAMPEP_0178403034 /NCGR_PEP_ID=MMETSP0689_2-20121128/17159_1 /TAXON_ID=160604 /ORGANISM="Amphidinium massartii, Strain CS-259" /LENGTH=178 /DNA_ID=CAMNT_0020023973 /DNA_START=96 /DNA_END=632 /DNA_ORIENTATION=+
MAVRARTSLLSVALVVLSCTALLCFSARAFVPSPARRSGAATAGLLGGATFSPLAALADLPPLEDLEMNELNPDPVRSTGMSFLSFDENTAPMYGLVVLGAITWAVTIVNVLRPAKDEEGVYKTYLGGGALPPEGYTNPLDPRLSMDDEDEDVYANARAERQKVKTTKAKETASSAVV